MKILFQGDSITDAGRKYGDRSNLGNGYVKFSAELIKKKYYGTDFEFINLGINGHRAENLLARWEKDAIEINPDIISILIGVNDTWHFFGSGKEAMSHQYFEDCYRKILEDLKKRTNAKILILEQFLLPAPDKDFFREDLDTKIDITRKLAREYADAFIPLDGLFAAASLTEDPKYWAADAVHPTEAGAKFIAKHYLSAVSPLIDAVLAGK